MKSSSLRGAGRKRAYYGRHKILFYSTCSGWLAGGVGNVDETNDDAAVDGVMMILLNILTMMMMRSPPLQENDDGAIENWNME